MESEHRASRASRSVPVREATMVTSLISSPSQLRPRRVGGLADPGYGLEPCLMLQAPHCSDSPCVGTLPVEQACLWLVLLASLAAGAQAFYPRAVYSTLLCWTLMGKEAPSGSGLGDAMY